MKFQKKLAALAFAVLVSCGALFLPSADLSAAEYRCTHQGGGNYYCANEDGWCWFMADPSDDVCGQWE